MHPQNHQKSNTRSQQSHTPMRISRTHQKYRTSSQNLTPSRSTTRLVQKPTSTGLKSKYQNNSKQIYASYSKDEQKQQRSHSTNKSESIEFKHFNQRLHNIQDRITQLKVKLQKKKFEKQKRQVMRQKIISDRRAKQQIKIDDNEKKKKKKSSTKLDLYVSQQRPKKPSFKIEKLGGFVTQAPQPEGQPLKFNPYSPRNNVYYISEVLKGYQQQFSIIREHLKNSIQFLGFFSEMKLPPLANRKVDLPQRPSYKNKLTVVFDLDETLIHCNDDLYQDHQVQLPIKFPTGEQIVAGINIRPNAKKILADLAPDFQIIVFTASHPCYANVVIDYLDPYKQYIQHRLYRQDCYLVPGGGPYVKDLRIINRDLSKLVLIDNAAYSYAFQPDNGIPIIPYYEGPEDYELLALKNYLYSLRLEDDVRDMNRKMFQFRKYPQFDPEDVDIMVKELYCHLQK